MEESISENSHILTENRRKL